MRVVAGAAKGRRLVSAPASVTRAATERIRMSLFGILEPFLAGARVLDLFAGAGTLGIEALSRGAAHATFVERDRRAVAALRQNLDATRMSDRSTVVPAEVLGFLDRDPGGPYELVFCDPPFAAVATLEATLAHPGLRGALAGDGLVVSRIMRKHPAAIPAGATVERTKDIGEEALVFLRYPSAR